MQTPGSIFSMQNPNDSVSRMQHKNNNFSQQPSKSMQKVSVYDNNESTIGKERYTLVQHPLRTKVTTGKPAQLGHSPSMSVFRKQQANQIANSLQPEDTIASMKRLQKDRLKEQHERHMQNKKGNTSDTSLPKI